MYSSDFKTLAREYTWLTIRRRSPVINTLWGMPRPQCEPTYSLCLLKF